LFVDSADVETALTLRQHTYRVQGCSGTPYVQSLDDGKWNFNSNCHSSYDSFWCRGRVMEKDWLCY